MNIFRFAVVVLAMVALVVSCSKEKKEEAEKLQQELMKQDTVVDTVVDTVMRAAMDSAARLGDAGAVPQEEAEPRYMPKQPVGEGFTVQIASSPGREYAEHLIDRYVQRGYEPYMTTVTVDGETYYRIRIGQFQTLAEATALKAELIDRFSISPWVDVIQP